MGPQFGSRVLGLLLATWISGVLIAQDLPKDAQLLVEENAKTIAEIKKTAEAQTKAANEQFRVQLEKLQTAYTKDGKLDEAVAIRDYLRSSARGAQKIKGEPDPSVLTAYRSEVGRVLYFEVTGSDYGNLYGTDAYTHDSKLAAAAVHAGVLKLGERGVVKVTILPPQSSFKSSGRNGVSSSAWSSTEYECFKVEPATAPETAPNTAGKAEASPADRSDVRADPGNLRGYRDQVGKSFLFEVTGAAESTIYGTDLYSDDSPLRTAVVHAGILSVGKKGLVKVTILGPQEEFASSSRNGVTSTGWGSYFGSYKVEPVNDPVRTIELKANEVKNAVIKDALNQIEGLKEALKKP